MSEPFSAAAARFARVEEAILTEAADEFQATARVAAPRRRSLTTVAEMAGSEVLIRGIPKAQWRWAEDGTRTHRIGAPRKFLKGEGFAHPIRGVVSHPGSHGERAWTRTVEAFEAEYPKIVETEVRKALG